MIKLIVSILSPIFIMIQPLYSQNDQDENKKNNLLPIEYNIKSTPVLQFDNTDHLLVTHEFSITPFMVRYPNYSATSSINLNRIMNQDFDYNYLLKLEITRSQPLMYDFNKSKTDWIFNNFFISRGSSKTTYLGLGEYFQFGVGLKWKPSNKFSVDAGSFFSRQYNHFSGLRSDIYGLNTRTHYDLTDKLQFNIYGQYVGFSRSNFFYGNTLFPNSNIGSSLSYKVKNQTQIEVGVKYQYNENRKIWDVESASKISIGF